VYVCLNRLTTSNIPIYIDEGIFAFGNWIIFQQQYLYIYIYITTWCFLYNFKHNLKLKHMLYVFNIGMFIFQFYLKTQWHITDHKSNKQVGLSCKNNDLQNTTQKTKDWVTRTPLKCIWSIYYLDNQFPLKYKMIYNVDKSWLPVHWDSNNTKRGTIKLVQSRHFLLKCLYQTRKEIGHVFDCWGIEFASFYYFDVGLYNVDKSWLPVHWDSNNMQRQKIA
jgi:hypothetical protein